MFYRQIAHIIYSLIFAVALLLSNSAAFALPVDVELDRYLLAIEKHIKEENFSAAEIYLQRIKDLESPTELQLPSQHHYYYGVVLRHNNRLLEARQHFERYIELVGKEGEFYQQTLEAITETEEAALKERQVKIKDEEQQTKRTHIIGQLNQVQSSLDNDYDLQIKDLYLSKNTVNALILHINSILSSYPYSGSRIQTTDNSKAVVYKVRINNENDIITLKQDNTSVQPLIKTNKQSVYGINPFIDFQCDANSARCEIKTPDNDDTWVELAYEKGAAQEVAYAFSRLIKALQRSNQP